MVDILFFPDYEPNHVHSTFKIAHNLKNKGYRIAFLCVVDVKEMIQAEGFRAIPVFEDLYPEGTLRKVNYAKTETSLKENEDILEIQEHRLQMLNGRLDKLMRLLCPRLIVTCCFLPFESLIMHYKYNIEQIIYHPLLPSLDLRRKKPNVSLAEIVQADCLNEINTLKGEYMGLFLKTIRSAGKRFSHLTEIVNPISQMPQLLICPDEMEIVDVSVKPNEIISGPGVNDDAEQIEYRMMEFLPADHGKKLLFASIGPRVNAFSAEASKVFELLIEVMKEPYFQHYHLIVSIGNLDKSSFAGVPDNVSLHNWVPQGPLLKHLSMAITHGGLGTIKECVNAGVPMLVFPLVDDQFDNAKRVEHNQLGLQANIETIRLTTLTNKMIHILDSKEIKDHVARMEVVFHEAENKRREVAFISDLIGEPIDVDMAEFSDRIYWR